jgi:hypothetical protein
VLHLVLGEIRAEIAAQLPQRDSDVAALEAELATARGEQKRFAKAVAMADDVPELVSELKKRSLLSSISRQIIAAKRTPDDLAVLVTKIEASARAKLQDLRNALADRTESPRGLPRPVPGRAHFHAGAYARRRTSGLAQQLREPQLGGSEWSRLRGDPNGIRTRVTGVKGRCPRPLDDGVFSYWCEPRRIRTFDPRLKRPVLYRLSYGPGNVGRVTLREKRWESKS